MLDLFDTVSAPTDSRPVLVGMNNPLHDDPRYALFPSPSSATGYKIWQMLSEMEPSILRKHYIDRFDRRNVLNSRTWDKKAAREQSSNLWRELAGRTVVLLGREVLEVLRLSQTLPLQWHGPLDYRTGGQPARWCYMPHPSGLNHWYNNPVNRYAAALRLEQLFMENRQ